MKIKPLCSVLFLSSFLTPAFGMAAVAHADLTAPSQKTLTAHVLLMDSEKGIVIKADVKGLKPGEAHGFHIHEKGECKGPDFKSAGGHWNPDNHPHSSPAAEKKHMGDMGNLVANAKGEALMEVFIPGGQGKTLKDFVGKAIIIHTKADDLSSQPTGDAGERLACGVIKEGKTK